MYIGCPCRDSGDPDFVPTIFSYTPVGKKTDYVLQAKVERHQRLVERYYAKKKTIAAESLRSLNFIHLKRAMCLELQHRHTEVCVILQHRQTLMFQFCKGYWKRTDTLKSSLIHFRKVLF
ncbi:hypothetical protein ACJMK2_040024 [Sinanodonta woodiana]|uniref:Uncharacterized protein n=1 Tax=Sinanodonta woodiana TaxID=1069815 RepID=A0ABD3WDR3_SINWO